MQKSVEPFHENNYQFLAAKSSIIDIQLGYKEALDNIFEVYLELS